MLVADLWSLSFLVLNLLNHEKCCFSSCYSCYKQMLISSLVLLFSQMLFVFSYINVDGWLWWLIDMGRVTLLLVWLYGIKSFSIQVKEFPAHTAAVNDLSFDVDGEYVGSCSDDGSVVINSLFTDEKMKFDYHRPMKAISLDPDYTRKMSRRFVAGGLAGHLYLNSKKWLGYRDQVCTTL